MKAILTICVFTFCSVSFAEVQQRLMCTLQNTINGHNFPYDETIYMTVRFNARQMEHRIEVEGENLGYCGAKIFATDHNGKYSATTMGVEGATDCAINKFVVSWRGMANSVDIDSMVTINSYGGFVFYGEADYACEIY